MFLYVVTFGDGSKMDIRANDPKQANERAQLIGIVASIRSKFKRSVR